MGADGAQAAAPKGGYLTSGRLQAAGPSVLGGQGSRPLDVPPHHGRAPARPRGRYQHAWDEVRGKSQR